MITLNHQGRTHILVPCRACGDSVGISVLISEYEDFANGALAQDAFTTLSAAEREPLISGVCGTCFDYLFKEEGEPNEY